MTARRFILAALALTACRDADDGDATPVALVQAEAWERVVDPLVDVFAAERPADAVCDDVGWSVDPTAASLEVETDLCDYLTVRQPALVALEPGDRVTVFAYHDDLDAPMPAEGYLGLAIDGELVWELSVEIPSEAADLEQTFTVDRSFALADEVQFHLHNHGPNTWELIAVRVAPPE